MFGWKQSIIRYSLDETILLIYQDNDFIIDWFGLMIALPLDVKSVFGKFIHLLASLLKMYLFKFIITTSLMFVWAGNFNFFSLTISKNGCYHYLPIGSYIYFKLFFVLSIIFIVWTNNQLFSFSVEETTQTSWKGKAWQKEKD